MLIVSIVLLVLAVAAFIIEIKVYKVLSRCLRIQQEGKAYVKICAHTDMYGWVQNRDLMSLQNNTKTREEHIRVETSESTDLVQVQTIKEIQKVKSVIKIIMGNL